MWEGPCSAALTPALRKLQPAVAAQGDSTAVLPVGDGPWNIYGAFVSHFTVTKNLQMPLSGELKLRFVVCGLAEIVTEAKTATWGPIQRLSSPEKMPGCSSREARLSLSSRRLTSVMNVSHNFSFCHCKCTIVCLIHPLYDIAERYLSNNSV